MFISAGRTKEVVFVRVAMVSVYVWGGGGWELGVGCSGGGIWWWWLLGGGGGGGGLGVG